MAFRGETGRGKLSPSSPAGEAIKTEHDARVATGLVRPGSGRYLPAEHKTTPLSLVEARVSFLAGREARRR